MSKHLTVVCRLFKSTRNSFSLDFESSTRNNTRHFMSLEIGVHNNFYSRRTSLQDFHLHTSRSTISISTPRATLGDSTNIGHATSISPQQSYTLLGQLSTRVRAGHRACLFILMTSMPAVDVDVPKGCRATRKEQTQILF